MRRTDFGCKPAGPIRARGLKVLEWYSARRHSVVFVSLLLMLMLAPVTQEYDLQGWPLESLYLVSLAAAAGGIDNSRGRIWAIGVVPLTAALGVIGRRMGSESASEVATGLYVGLAVLAAVASLRFALQGEHADRERVGAALSAYLLAGQVFGICYWQIGQLRAGTFAAAGTPTPAGALDLPTCVYFSFVTLATLGYGDIAPLTPTARGLAVSEAIIGQLYLAVLIARLVGGRPTK